VRRLLPTVLAAISVAGVMHASVLMAASPKKETHTVTMEATGFSPATLTVNAGDRVVWVNKDPFPHTATAKAVFDSGPIAPNKRWTYTASKRGDFAYVCTLHPTMKGRLVVK
jgi:plastocyanin